MHKEVVWVFGTSAAGKQTFIRRAVKDNNLATELGWKGKKIVVCEASLNLLGHVGNKKVVEARIGIANSVLELLKESEVVLIKWQYIDTHNKIPQKLRKLLPNAKHRIILLKANIQEIHNRLSAKDWWKEFWDSTDFANSEYENVEKSLEDLSPDVEVTVLDSSERQNYKVIK